MLLEAGADPMARDWQGRTPLHIAAQSGQSDPGAGGTARALLDAGAELDAADRHGRTPRGMARGDISRAIEAWVEERALKAEIGQRPAGARAMGGKGPRGV